MTERGVSLAGATQHKTKHTKHTRLGEVSEARAVATIRIRTYLIFFLSLELSLFGAGCKTGDAAG